MFVIIIHSNTSIHLLNHFPIVGYLMTLNEGFFGSKRNNKHFGRGCFHEHSGSCFKCFNYKEILQTNAPKEPTQCTFPSQSQPDLSIKAFKVSIPPNGVIISD